jgi:hypothetical protein
MALSRSLKNLTIRSGLRLNRQTRSVLINFSTAITLAMLKSWLQDLAEIKGS